LAWPVVIGFFPGSRARIYSRYLPVNIDLHQGSRGDPAGMVAPDATRSTRDAMMKRPVMAMLGLGLMAAAPLAAFGEEKPADIQPPADARWRLVMKDQLKAEKNCDLADVLTYSELKIGDEIAISGRVSCIDGRQYDYSRPRPHQKFDFRLCEPSVC
jgi:hypothetical protein